MPSLVALQVLLVGRNYEWDVQWLQTERSRGFIAALIFMLDLFTVCQDWEFPFFDNPLEINLVGWTTPDLDLGCASCRFSGKWLNYGPMVLVMLLDANNLNNQWRYGFLDAPAHYGQYLDAEGWIWSVTNRTVADELRARNKNQTAASRSFGRRGACRKA